LQIIILSLSSHYDAYHILNNFKSIGLPLIFRTIRTWSYCPTGRQGEIAQSMPGLDALTRISHGLFTAAADPGMSIALRSVGLLDVLSSTSAEPSVARRLAKRRIHARLRRLATKSHEKCGLIHQGIRKSPAN
jgi:hypothetical protein